MAKKDSGESFKRNFMIYLLNCFFRGTKHRYCNHPQNIKDVDQIASLDWCKFIVQKLITSVRHYKESKSAKGVHFDDSLFFLMDRHHAVHVDPTRKSQLRSVIEHHGIKPGLNHLRNVRIVGVHHDHAKVKVRAKTVVVLREQVRAESKGFP
ncbi:LOW QUALITY PROTEIN: hypothetical protein Cgig2_013231 [Carnegiea gigantea]|uniref:Uncharacterized protein n=1 Tax=Carnegiea gigantea TaxID=171969 RepID=A0A9Q1GI86_9CARY|nr:LOW QUALITY PROTEIN: hypothetical protein Cgig2_013231 [Carnegiea gigantea]